MRPCYFYECGRLGSQIGIGLLLGISLTILLRCAVVRYSVRYCPVYRSRQPLSLTDETSQQFADCESPCEAKRMLYELESDTVPKYYTNKNLVLIGVMTAKDFLPNRALTAFQTWSKSIPGEVIFFTSDGPQNFTYPSGMKVIGLRSVDDVYPPQKKAFLMLKYMHDHFLDKFRFFVRADDDIYIRGDEYTKFLNSIKASGIPVIGSTGFGMKDELGKLNLGPEDNYCMGGPGMIMTREVLAKMAPHIKECLKDLYSNHEDVEIGRCIKQFANTSCTWSYQNIFYHNYDEPKGTFTRDLNTRELNKALTLHPVKTPLYVYRLHHHTLNLKAISLRNRLYRLQRQIHDINKLLAQSSANTTSSLSSRHLNVTENRTRDDLQEWMYIALRSQHATSPKNPRRRTTTDIETNLGTIWSEVSPLLNEMSEAEHSFYRFTNMNQTYIRVHPGQGLECVFSVSAGPKYSKLRRPNTRLHIRVLKPFLETEFIEFEEMNRGMVDSDRVTLQSNDTTESIVEAVFNKKINFILPLAGRFDTFLNFIRNYEDICLRRKENTSLFVMLYRAEANDTSADVIDYVNKIQQKYKGSQLRVILNPEKFSRGLAFQKAITNYSDDDLLMFIDVDIILQPYTLERIRLNTIQGQSVYAPIFFSQYDPNYNPQWKSMKLSNNPSDKFNSTFGYWRQYSFGMVALYKSDYIRSGGFKMNIKGWGLEDVDLLEKLIAVKINVFRSVDLGMVHKFHPILCDPNTAKVQYEMCIGTLVTTFASTETLADVVYRTPKIINRLTKPKTLTTMRYQPSVNSKTTTLMKILLGLTDRSTTTSTTRKVTTSSTTQHKTATSSTTRSLPK